MTDNPENGGFWWAQRGFRQAVVEVQKRTDIPTRVWEPGEAHHVLLPGEDHKYTLKSFESAGWTIFGRARLPDADVVF